MIDAIAIVSTFLDAASQGKDGLREAIRHWFAPGAVWENVGFSTTTGPDEAIALMDKMEPGIGLVSLRIETLAIAANGNTVLTERIDHLLGAKGETLLSLRLMGVFDLNKDGKITRWADYFDTVAMAPLMSAKA